MYYLHKSVFQSHGNLSSANCHVDSRWILKISGFALRAFRLEDSREEVSSRFSFACILHALVMVCLCVLQLILRVCVVIVADQSRGVIIATVLLESRIMNYLLSPVYSDTTQLNSTRRRVELSCELSRFGHLYDVQLS